jgi:hypothetical protein
MIVSKFGIATMARESKPKQAQMRARIAAAAARLMAEDGIDDFALAKRKGARQLGASDTRFLPANDEIEAELRAYQALFQGDEQRQRIRDLRKVALDAMHSLSAFNPYLAGAVLKGTAGRYADVDLQLFTDDHKAVELFLLNRDVPYTATEQRHYCGDEPRAAPVLRLEWRGTPMNVTVYGAKDERSVLKSSLSGRPIERLGINGVTALLARDN